MHRKIMSDKVSSFLMSKPAKCVSQSEMIMPGFPQVQKECCTYKVMHEQGPKLEFNSSLSHLSMTCSKTVKSTERSIESVQGTDPNILRIMCTNF